VELAGDASAPFGRPLASTAQEIYQYLSPTPTSPDPHADNGRTIRSLPYVASGSHADDRRTIRSLPYVPYHTLEPVIITNDQAYHTGSIQHNILSYQTCRNSMVCYQ
jgi:hypothetical protein